MAYIPTNTADFHIWETGQEYDPDDEWIGECECNVIGCPECDERALENFDCGMGADGQCGHAGSEDCDFECPYR